MSTWNCCRMCLGTASLSPIFIQEEFSEHYTNVIYIATGVKVELNDMLPQQLCNPCITFINETMKFRKKCELTQTILRNRMNGTQEVKQEFNKTEILTIDISDYIDDDFRDYDDNITLNTLQYTESEKLDMKISDNMEYKSEQETGEVNFDKAKREKVKRRTKKKEMNGELAKVHFSQTEKLLDMKISDNIEYKNEQVTREIIFDKAKKEKVKRRTKRKEINGENHFSHTEKLLEDTKISDNVEYKNEVQSKEIIFDNAKREKVKRTKKREMNGEKVKEEIECEYCHKILTSKLSIRNHYKIHTGFDVVCEHCGKKFITRRLLLMHCRAKHGYEKTDKCSYCDYRASNAEQVKIHERLHTGEKPYVCAECGAGFHRKSSYLQHVAIHLPEKTVQCPSCPSRFKSVTLMRIHAARHRAPRYAFTCAVCHNSFARRRNVARHVQRIHGLPPEPQTICRRKIT